MISSHAAMQPVGGLSSALKGEQGQGHSLSKAVQKSVPSGEPGTMAMRSHFFLPTGATYFNASYGNVPIQVMQAQWALQMECEMDPQAWMLGKVALKLRAVRERLARYVGSDVEDLVLVENCTSGTNAILRSLPISSGATLIHLSTAYGVVKNSLAHAAALAGAHVVEVPVEFHGRSTAPTGPGGVPLEVAVAQVIDNAQAHGSHVALGCFDHIASCPGVLMPVTAIARACASRGVPVMLDGAHVLGQLPVDMKQLEAAGVRYWVSDAHKWLFSPKGSAVLWVSKTAQHHMQPAALGAAVCSNASTANFNPRALEGLSEFETRFQYTGTRDYTAFAAIEAALDFREAIGERNIIEYNRGMAIWAQKCLAEMWDTETLFPDEQTMAMAHVRLPGVTTKRAADALSDALKKRHNIHVMMFALPNIPGDPTSGISYWVRPCVQVYVTAEDIERLGRAVLQTVPLLAAADAAARWRTAALQSRPLAVAMSLQTAKPQAQVASAGMTFQQKHAAFSPDSVLFQGCSVSSCNSDGVLSWASRNPSLDDLSSLYSHMRSS